MRELVEDLATIINRETKTLKLNITEFNLIEAVDSLQNELQIRFADKDLEFSADIPSDLKITGDRKRISQILRILIDNSIKFSPPNSEITIKAVDEYIPQQADKEKPGVLIKVIDNGIGIPEKDLSKLFERFYRGSNIENKKGSGLGLNIAKILVELHNGFISVDSKIGEGSTFSVFIPKMR
jgi:signal transduction histidine kinase